jgi:hypothetical protein
MASMTIREELLGLQWAQLKHDEAYHKDVVVLPLGQRIKHFVLHNAKYTAYLFEAVGSNDQARILKTLTDAFVITLASANTLNQDIGQELDDSATRAISIKDFGGRLIASLPRDDADPLWIVRTFAYYTGRLAKTCESLDHLESIPFRDTMKSCNLALFKAVWAEASARKIDLVDAYKVRIREVEARSIFDRHHREGAGGEA